MSEQWISNSGELEATMAGIYEEDPEMDVPCPGEIYFDRRWWGYTHENNVSKSESCPKSCQEFWL